jgi:anthranilate synthase/aminodeoxychorismate synthase-like glutamine amidotransferase
MASDFDRMILVIDNYDSFVENLARYIRLCHEDTYIVRNDKITLNEIDALNPSAIIISPGPCTPNEAGICLDLIQHVKLNIPILGICLGHQAIVQSFGGTVKKGDPCHGRTSIINHSKSDLFEKIPQNCTVGRYHSLVCDISTAPDLIETACTDDGINMGVQHRHHKIYGLQFHPESILTEYGERYIQNFLKVAYDHHH